MRYEIQGLRAIAVLAVVIFHAGFVWLPGGFLGVDVFLVISGFLITGGILRQINKGTFSLVDFYKRRIVRLLPSAAATIVVTLLVSFIIKSPDDVLDISQSAIASLFAVANIYFWSTVGYFDSDAMSKPLLHMWSLGVEEQFYLTFPILLLITIRCLGRRSVAPVVIVLGMMSFISANVAVSLAPSAVFYLMPFRVFEFAIGILLAIFLNERNIASDSRYLVTIIGLVLIIGSMFLMNDMMPMPSYLSLIPCITAI